ncbi:MAG: hypothetical protein II304_05950 [Bacteroidales bacterium]|nr:hypothetical protein [Bacteroidales bacterium]
MFINRTNYVYSKDFTKSTDINATICSAVTLFDESEFRRFITNNKIIEDGCLTETTISAILDKWPAFFDGMKVETNEDIENVYWRYKDVRY